MDSPDSLDRVEAAEHSDTPAIDHRRLIKHNTQSGPQHSEQAKTLALSIYAETGSVQTASRETGIPRSTIGSWIERDPDIDAKVDALRRVVREQTAHLQAEIARRSAEELLDRVNNGDYHVDKEGEVTRRPVPARELAFINSIATDKHARLTGTMGKTRAEDQAITTLMDGLVKEFESRRLKARAQDALTYPQADDSPNA